MAPFFGCGISEFYSVVNNQNCPLCVSENTQLYCVDKRREYWQCDRCALVFVPRSFWLNEMEEKAEYDKHMNSPSDQGYRTFLGRIFHPLMAMLPAYSKGLDFGCGPGPTLSVMFQEQGIDVALYDKFYCPDRTCLGEQYDFVTCTEVWEHLQCPEQYLSEMWQCVKPEGVLGVMTKLVDDVEAFKTWHYKNDPTHIVFFSVATLHYLARKWGAELTVLGRDTFYFIKGK